MVTIYNGVRWGWQYRFIPDRNPILIPRPVPFPIPRPIPIPIVSPVPSPTPTPAPTPTPPPCSGGSGGGGCARNFTARTADWEVPLLSSEDVDAATISNDAFEESEVANSIEDTLTSSSSSEYFNFFEDLEQGFFDSNENDEFQYREWSFFDLNGNRLDDTFMSSDLSDDDSEPPKSVPEPTTTLGLLALGVLGVAQKLLKKINQ